MRYKHWRACYPTHPTYTRAWPQLAPAAHCNPYPSPCGTAAATAGSVDTARHPDDTAAILLRCHQLLGHHFAIRSEASWDTEWARGGAPAVLVARTVLAELFGPISQSSPLIWPHQTVRAQPEGHQHA